MKSVSSTTPSPRGPRLRKKRKRLDAICESVYKQNHSEPKPRDYRDDVASGWDEGLELRRSSRVRRAPVVLDASPPPVKKRKKKGKRVELSRWSRGGKGKVGKLKEEEEESGGEEEEEEEDMGTLGDWRSRLRSRSRGLKSERGWSGRKFFEEEDEGTLVVVRSKRSGRIKALSGLGSQENEGGGEEKCGGEEDGLELGADKGLENDVIFLSERDCDDEEDNPVFVGDRDVRNQDDAAVIGEVGSGDEVEEPRLVGWEGVENEEVRDVEAAELQVDGEECEERLVGLCSEPRSDKDGDVEEEDEEKRDSDGEDLVNVMDKKETNVVQINEGLVDEIKGGQEGVAEEVPINEIPVNEIEKVANAHELKHAPVDAPRKTRIKQGRRCGLCGCGNDGKPPKKKVQDAGDSENEAYIGSSASEETNYDVWDGFGDEPDWLGQLLGPINDRFGIAGIWVHQHCAVWSPEVYFAGLGRLKNVRAALCRGRALKCSRCGRPGATIGCRVDRCPKTYHLPCARAEGCIFDHRKFLIACTDHRHLFQPHGYQYLLRLKKLKARKMKLEIRKQSSEASRKDIEDEERWLEKCGEDEEFLKRESKRLHRDLLRIAPVYIGGSDSECGKLFEGWESVAGLQDVIQCMKEVVLIPLLYPEFFSNLGITPPRGVLLHGHPGTGKTLVVRALIGSCARGDKRIAYFARKGADCLGKYVGDAERQLRLLFQVAEKCQPSIIFFDEIDGLAPCRTRQQDQTHSSVVSTLLALMDGLKSRGSVIVIGATNRPDAVDPALRRPGRFDREIYFPLPSVEDRAAILSLHTKRWPRPVGGSLLDWVARKTVGFAGADLQALCTQAAIIALKRNFPLQEVLSSAGVGASAGKRLPLPAFAVGERDWLEALAVAPPPCSRRVDGVSLYDFVSSPLPVHLVPCLLRPLLTLLVSLYLDERLWLPNSLAHAARMVKSVTIFWLRKRNLPIDDWWCHVGNILEEPNVAKEIHRRLSHTGILVGQACTAGSDTSNDEVEYAVNLEPTNVHCGGMQTSLFGSPSLTSGRRSGFRVLIAGSTGFGQRHLASCILQCFVGNVEIYKVDLATFSHEGHGDIVQGITQILLKCVSLRSCMIFMPRIDLWAVETFNHITEESEDACEMESSSLQTESGNQPNSELSKTIETADNQAVAIRVSQAWSTFIEQLESTCASTPLMILATSELPFEALPDEIRQFFKGDSSSSHNTSSLQHTLPRFLVHLDGNLSPDAVIRLSAAELLRDLMHSFIQLVHQRTHTRAHLHWETNGFGSAQCHSKAEPHMKGEAKVVLTRDSSIGVPPTPKNRSSKGKLTLLLAISTFGYQILRYPHFAELCWFTSKLKEGPLADVSGPWKGWPFNSCIIRPNNSLDEEAVACSATPIKNKDRSGVVRGLMAVGLLAYRGEYKSLREVSFEVRKVLELLAGQIGERIQSGKDRYQYVRLLSQVAYLEDMVNNWAYTLQSLEVGTQINAADSKQNPMELSENRSCIVMVQGEECKRNASDRSYFEGELLEPDLTKLASENLEDESKQEDNPGNSDRMSAYDANVLDNDDETMAAAELFGKQNGSTCDLCDNNHTVSKGNCESPKHGHGFMSKEADNDIPKCVEVHDLESSGGNSCNDLNELHKVEGAMRSYVDPDGRGHVEMNCAASNIPCVPESGVTCLYHCCSRCVYLLYDMLKKILLAKWGSPAGNLSVQDVHDVVSSLSVELLSAIRRIESAKSEDSVLQDMMLTTQCEGPGNRLLTAMECDCHSVDDGVTATTNYEDVHWRLDTDFVFRDGVIVPADSNGDVSFHCTYNSLCLCSLGKSILMSKVPLC